MNLNPSEVSLLQSVNMRAVMVTARARPGADYHFVSRFFAPNVGRPEDAVTGSSHCGLGPYWTQKLYPDASMDPPDGGPWVKKKT